LNTFAHRTRTLAATLVLMLAAACARDAPEPASAPIFAPKAALAAYLAGVYGADASREGAWTEGADDERVQRSVCAFGQAEGDVRNRYLLAVCGQPQGGGHASPGLVDFHLLEPTPTGFHPIAVARGQEFGSDGDPGTITLVQLGRQRAGFLVEEAWTGQGYVFGTRTVTEFRDGTLHKIATVRSAMSNAGAVDCTNATACANAGFELAFAQSFDTSEPYADAYPLLVHETGRECGAAVDRRHRLPFDAGAGRYTVPDALMREDCLAPVDADSALREDMR
jgi:hypothetical protein